MCFRWFCDCVSGGVNKFDFRVEQPGWRGVGRKFCCKFSEILGQEQDVRKKLGRKRRRAVEKSAGNNALPVKNVLEICQKDFCIGTEVIMDGAYKNYIFFLIFVCFIFAGLLQDWTLFLYLFEF